MGEARLLLDVVVPEPASQGWRLSAQELQLEAVHEAVDRTRTPLGGQLLFAELVGGSEFSDTLHDPQPDQRESWARAFEVHPPLRAQVERELGRLDGPSSWLLPHLLWDDLPQAPLPVPILRALGLALPLSLLGVFWFPPILLFSAALALANFLLHTQCQSRIGHLTPALGALSQLLATVPKLAAIPALDVPGLELSTDARRIMRSAGVSSLPPDPTGLLETFDAFLLLRTTGFYALREGLVAHRAEVRGALVAVAEIDLALSVASLRREKGSAVCQPSVHATELRVVQGRHPLVADCVPNDVTLEVGSGMLLIGSNRGGKSTFLRMLATNAVLARVLGTVFAREWGGPVLDVWSSFEIRDDLEEGTSFFVAEAERLRAILESQPSGVHPRLILLDEIFRGTNPKEREAAATELLLALLPGSVVAAATHDLGLCDALDGHYRIFNFQETTRRGEAGEAVQTFDYRLREGRDYASNALATLRALGYPEDLVRAAEQRVRS